MSKKSFYNLDYNSQEEILGAYAGCSACMQDDDDNKSEEDRLWEQCRAFIDMVNMMKEVDDE